MYSRGLCEGVSRLGPCKSQSQRTSPVTRNKWTLLQCVAADTNLQFPHEIFSSRICPGPVTRRFAKRAAPKPFALSLEAVCHWASDAAWEGVCITYPMLFSTAENSRKRCYKQQSYDRDTWSMQIRWTQAREHLPPLSTGAISWHSAPLKSCRWQVP